VSRLSLTDQSSRKTSVFAGVLPCQAQTMHDTHDNMASAEQQDPIEAAKRKAAAWAASQIEDGMAVGLGSGSTAALFIDEVGRRVASGLRITAIATSEQSHRQALGLGIPMTDFARQPHLDLTIDGADEVQRGTLHLIKGHGGALLREKIVAMASRRLLIAVDPRKLGFTSQLRTQEDGQPYVTDGHHYILHCNLPQSGFTAANAAEAFKRTVGVVEHGLFLGMASQVIIGALDGIEILEPSR
jgi:ribose 5-phosphate isomerase A